MERAIFTVSGKEAEGDVVKVNGKTVLVRYDFTKTKKVDGKDEVIQCSKVIKRHRTKHNVSFVTNETELCNKPKTELGE